MIIISISDRFKNAWDAFQNKSIVYEEKEARFTDIGAGSSVNPDAPNLRIHNERTVINSIYTRIAIDISQLKFYEGMKNEDGDIITELNSSMTEVLTVSPNIDETPSAFLIHTILSLFDEGNIAIVPTKASCDPRYNSSYEVYEMRVAKILQWYPQKIQVEVYNDITGKTVQLYFPKHSVYIIPNPFFSIMNRPNSLAKRLNRKLMLLDALDERQNSGKLDLLIQLPYVIKSEAKKDEAKKRVTSIEEQLANSKYGIAYTDGTEKVIQLNRAIENNLQSQIEYLTKQLYSQLGMTEAIIDGTADEQVMLNYYGHTIEPIANAIVQELNRKYLTKTARTQGHIITFFRDPFKLVPINNIADIADKFTRNEILSSNEIRSIIGRKPQDTAAANSLRNKNLNVDPETLKAEEENYISEQNGNSNSDNNLKRNSILQKPIEGLKNSAKEESHMPINFDDDKKR